MPQTTSPTTSSAAPLASCVSPTAPPLHYSVLREEMLDCMLTGRDTKGGICIDCTLGYGGHTLGILERSEMSVYGFDRDESAITLARGRLSAQLGEGLALKERLHLTHAPFSQALSHISSEVLGATRVIMVDLGVSSMQLDNKARGFSFTSPNLDMRMDSHSNLTAQKILNSYPASRLEELFRIYGEIRQSKKLSDIIAHQREKKPFESAQELAQLIERHFPRVGGIHPATLAFQALRIEVNDELGEIKALLESIESAARRGELRECRVGIISFHSLEDRLIKQSFKQWSKSCICPESAFKCECGDHHALGQILNKKPILPSEREIKENKRSRSAKLRVFDISSTKERE